MTLDVTRARPSKPRRGPVAALIACVAVFMLIGLPFVYQLFRPTVPATVIAASTQPTTTRGVRSIVFIVPGTYGNEGFWPNVIPGKATFASELQHALGESTTIYPCLWYAANDHANREAAAKQVAALIDEKAGGYDRIYLVGHSHGGNVALLAAGLAHHRIDAVVCLSTPQVYLLAKSASAGTVEMPVYCSVQSRGNAAKIVAACADADSVPDVWSDSVKGIDDNTAIALTHGWQEEHNHPRLGEDGFWAHTFGRGNVKVTKSLSVADANVTIRSFVADRLGISPHYASHSRRMGSVVGGMLRDGCSPEAVDYLRTLVQPADADYGGPIDEAAQVDWWQKNAGNVVVAGWRLDHASIKLDPAAAGAARNSAGGTPEPYLRIQNADRKILYESETRGRTNSLDWDADFILWRGPAYFIGVYAQHNMKRDTTLGDRSVGSGQVPPGAWGVDLGKGIFWAGDFVWTAVHY